MNSEFKLLEILKKTTFFLTYAIFTRKNFLELLNFVFEPDQISQDELILTYQFLNPNH